MFARPDSYDGKILIVFEPSSLSLSLQVSVTGLASSSYYVVFYDTAGPWSIAAAADS